MSAFFPAAAGGTAAARPAGRRKARPATDAALGGGLAPSQYAKQKRLSVFFSPEQLEALDADSSDDEGRPVRDSRISRPVTRDSGPPPAPAPPGAAGVPASEVDALSSSLAALRGGRQRPAAGGMPATASSFTSSPSERDERSSAASSDGAGREEAEHHRQLRGRWKKASSTTRTLRRAVVKPPRPAHGVLMKRRGYRHSVYHSDGELPPLRGWLQKKQRKGLGLWQRRWFVAMKNYLNYYDTDNEDGEPLASIDLRQLTTVALAGADSAEFKLVGEDLGTLRLRASEHVAAQKWVTGLQNRQVRHWTEELSGITAVGAHAVRTHEQLEEEGLLSADGAGSSSSSSSSTTTASRMSSSSSSSSSYSERTTMTTVVTEEHSSSMSASSISSSSSSRMIVEEEEEEEEEEDAEIARGDGLLARAIVRGPETATRPRSTTMDRLFGLQRDAVAVMGPGYEEAPSTPSSLSFASAASSTASSSTATTSFSSSSSSSSSKKTSSAAAGAVMATLTSLSEQLSEAEVALQRSMAAPPPAPSSNGRGSELGTIVVRLEAASVDLLRVTARSSMTLADVRREICAIATRALQASPDAEGVVPHAVVAGAFTLVVHGRAVPQSDERRARLTDLASVLLDEPLHLRLSLSSPASSAPSSPLLPAALPPAAITAGALSQEAGMLTLPAYGHSPIRVTIPSVDGAAPVTASPPEAAAAAAAVEAPSAAAPAVAARSAEVSEKVFDKMLAFSSRVVSARGEPRGALVHRGPSKYTLCAEVEEFMLRYRLADLKERAPSMRVLKALQDGARKLNLRVQQLRLQLLRLRWEASLTEDMRATAPAHYPPSKDTLYGELLHLLRADAALQLAVGQTMPAEQQAAYADCLLRGLFGSSFADDPYMWALLETSIRSVAHPRAGSAAAAHAVASTFMRHLLTAFVAREECAAYTSAVLEPALLMFFRRSHRPVLSLEKAEELIEVVHALLQPLLSTPLPTELARLAQLLRALPSAGLTVEALLFDLLLLPALRRRLPAYNEKQLAPLVHVLRAISQQQLPRKLPRNVRRVVMQAQFALTAVLSRLPAGEPQPARGSLLLSEVIVMHRSQLRLLHTALLTSAVVEPPPALRVILVALGDEPLPDCVIQPFVLLDTRSAALPVVDELAWEQVADNVAYLRQLYHSVSREDSVMESRATAQLARTFEAVREGGMPHLAVWAEQRRQLAEAMAILTPMATSLQTSVAREKGGSIR